ncbi:MAG: PfkB family carbohydrate kinase [Candidatus Ratteibacteria bacterium]|jgi:sugar/nucleoside kinase (ribokinase family)
MSLLVVGSVALDTVKTPFGAVHDILGGSASYFSISASFFTEVHLVAVVGKDFPPDYRDIFLEKGIRTEGLQTKDGETFRWKGHYDFDLNDAKTDATMLNVFGGFDPVLSESSRNCSEVFLANIDPVLQLRVLKQVKNPRIVACDTMNYWIETRRKELLRLLTKVDLFFLNDAEARQLAEEPMLTKAARKISAMGPKMVIIKKGEHGALMFVNGVFSPLPAFSLEEVFDPTGAGDSFAGGTMGFLAQSKKLHAKAFRRAMGYGTVLASFAVEKFSLQRLLSLTREDIEERYRTFSRKLVI